MYMPWARASQPVRTVSCSEVYPARLDLPCVAATGANTIGPARAESPHCELRASCCLATSAGIASYCIYKKSSPQRRRKSRGGTLEALTVARQRMRRSTHFEECHVEWLEASASAPVEAETDKVIMPVLVKTALEWPGSSAQVMVADTGCRKLYDDMLMSGKRHLLQVFADGHPDFDTTGIAEDLRVHAIGSVLQLEDLQEVAGLTDDRVKYHADHSVLGRARITRLVKPAEQLGNDTGNSFENHYFLAEVELLKEDERHILRSAEKRNEEWKAQLIKVWGELNDALRQTSQPWWCDYEFVREGIDRTSSWHLISMWHQLQLLRHQETHRALVMNAIKDWIQQESKAGRLSGPITSTTDMRTLGLPEKLLVDYAEMRRGNTPPPSLDAWEPFLAMLAANSASERGELLLAHAREELAVIRARGSLEKMLR